MYKMDEVLSGFYTSFSQLNAEEMVKHYHKDIVFRDPAFGELKGEHAKNMWRMLCSRTKKMDVDFYNMGIDPTVGVLRWEAHYTFSPTNRRIHNVIDAKYKFKDGKIIEHIDSFSLHHWAGQAYGLKGKLLGWTWFFKKKFQEETRAMLKRFEEKNAVL